MQVAHGVVKLWKEAGHSALHAQFNVDGRSPLHFIGRFNPPVEEFECHDAILAYGSLDALTASHKFFAKIGTSSIFITIADSGGPTIEGQLTQPLDPASRVVGFGSWFENVAGSLRSDFFVRVRHATDETTALSWKALTDSRASPTASGTPKARLRVVSGCTG